MELFTLVRQKYKQEIP